jgi:hypothetical protein
VRVSRGSRSLRVARQPAAAREMTQMRRAFRRHNQYGAAQRAAEGIGAELMY